MNKHCQKWHHDISIAIEISWCRFWQCLLIVTFRNLRKVDLVSGCTWSLDCVYAVEIKGYLTPTCVDEGINRVGVKMGRLLLLMKIYEDSATHITSLLMTCQVHQSVHCTVGMARNTGIWWFIRHILTLVQGYEICINLQPISPCGCGNLSVRLGSRIGPHRHRVVVEVHWRGAQGWRSVS